MSEHSNQWGNLLQFPLKARQRGRLNSNSPDTPSGSLLVELSVSNDQLAEVLEDLCSVCASVLQGATSSDCQLVSDHLTAALDKSAHIKELLKRNVPALNRSE
jgi:hypothetical protein